MKIKNTITKYKTKKGFTLMEILISLMILSVISISIFAIFSQALNVWSKAASDMKKYGSTRAFLDKISLELSCATIDRWIKTDDKANMTFIGEPPGATTNGNKGSEIRFFANISTSGSSHLSEIGYWLDNKGNIIRYSRTSGLNFFDTSYTPFTVTPPTTTIIANDIYDLQIRYWIPNPAGGGTFKDNKTWDSFNGIPAKNVLPDVLPEAVQIEVIVKDEYINRTDKNRVDSFTTVIYLPQAEVFR